MPLPKTSSILLECKAQALLVSSLTNIRYLTGLSVSAGFVLVTKRAITFFADSRYIEAAKSAARCTVKDINELEKVLRKVDRCGFEAEDVTVERLRRWKRNFKNTKFVQTSGIIEEFRRQKDGDEIKKFRKAQRITQNVMQKVPKLLKKGISEKELAWKLESLIRGSGAESMSFEPIVAFGKNSALPHHHPGKTKLKKRDIVQIDMGAKFEGYCADQSRVFIVGSPTDKQKFVFDAVEEAKNAATKAVKVGVTTHELDAIARKVLQKYNLEQYFTHSLGHGVGLDIHEGVSLSQKGKKQKLLAGEIITIEPGVYIPGEFGVRLEDEVIVGV